jgi:dihydrofolate reductase
MGSVIVDITMSLDGFVTGPNAGIDNGLGDGGMPLHDWVFEGVPEETALLRDAVAATGAVVMGRRTFDTVDGPHGWSDELGFGAGQVPPPAESPAFFVVTHRAPEQVRLGLPFTFVIDGVASAVEQARAAAGERDVRIMGGGDVARQVVAEGLADDVFLHVAHMILGAGTPLFRDGDPPAALERVRVLDGPATTHLLLRMRR